MRDRFELADDVDASDIAGRLCDQIRADRRQLGLSQQAFAMRAGIPLRTYKRLELKECDSLATLLAALVAIDPETASSRLRALRLLFLPAPVADVARTPVAAMQRLLAKKEERTRRTESNNDE